MAQRSVRRLVQRVGAEFPVDRLGPCDTCGYLTWIKWLARQPLYPIRNRLWTGWPYAMGDFRWTEKMSVGIPELDADHKELIRVINQLGADAGDIGRVSAVRQSLFALLRYAEFHFAREEKVMAACRYFGLAEHKHEHREFVSRIRDLNRRFDQDPEGSAGLVNDALMQFLQDWLNHHILIEDKAYQIVAGASSEARHAAKQFKAIEIWWSG